jgi:hypothetical protein
VILTSEPLMMMDSPSQPGSLAHAGKTRNTGKVAINRLLSIAFEARCALTNRY